MLSPGLMAFQKLSRPGWLSSSRLLTLPGTILPNISRSSSTKMPGWRPWVAPSADEKVLSLLEWSPSEQSQFPILPADLKSISEIHESRIHAWDSVKTRKHVLHKVYSLGRACDDVVILGSLQSELKNGRSFEMEFAARAIFARTNSDRLEARDYKIWAVCWLTHLRRRPLTIDF